MAERLELNRGLYEIEKPLFADFQISGLEILYAGNGVILSYLDRRGRELALEHPEKIVCLGYALNPGFWESGKGDVGEGRWVFAKPGTYYEVREEEIAN